MSENRIAKNNPGLKPETTSEERTWAALVHLSTVLSLGGLLNPLVFFFPLTVYFAYKGKSQYVEKQALQAFLFQSLGSPIAFAIVALIGALILVIIWLITGILCLILIGFVLIPVAVIITIIVALVISLYPVVAPLTLGILSILATIQTLNGEDFQMPFFEINLTRPAEAEPLV